MDKPGRLCPYLGALPVFHLARRQSRIRRGERVRLRGEGSRGQRSLPRSHGPVGSDGRNHQQGHEWSQRVQYSRPS